MSSSVVSTHGLVLCLLACLAFLGDARIGTRTVRDVSVDAVESNLMSELAGALGHHGNTGRLAHIEDLMRPMFRALPKDENGGLSHAAVRYALHRFFVQHHGWHMKGLEPAGSTWNDSSPSGILKDRVPAHVLALVEQYLGGRLFGLHELAVLAATLDDLVHSEAMERLSTAYISHDVPFQASVTKHKGEMIIRTYMMFYVVPSKKYALLKPHQIQRLLDQIHRVYPGWHDTVLWINDLMNDLRYSERMLRNPFWAEDEADMDFPSIAYIVEQIGMRFGQFQNLECRSLKDALVTMEDLDTGRVPLSSFYGSALDGGWQFKESQDYLHDLGVLDESDPQRVRVVIPNYLTGRSNCLASSSFYSVCCMDECEGIVAELERRLQAPSAAPRLIAEVVMRTQSDTVDAPRNLSVTLHGRLEDIAVQNGGLVPLYGRLFAQWMHHAYPRECPYPMGTSNVPRTPNEWMSVSNRTSAQALVSVMQMHKNSSVTSGSAEFAEPTTLRWSDEEELMFDYEPVPRSWRSKVAPNLAAVVALVFMAASVRQTAKLPSTDLLPLHRKAHYV